jgi:hypothetical protein
MRCPLIEIKKRKREVTRKRENKGIRKDILNKIKRK